MRASAFLFCSDSMANFTKSCAYFGEFKINSCILAVFLGILVIFKDILVINCFILVYLKILKTTDARNNPSKLSISTIFQKWYH